MFSFLKKIDKQTIKREFKHAFSIRTSQEDKALDGKENALIAKLAMVIKKRRLTIPAIMFFECIQPLNYIGSQAMLFFRPFLAFFFSTKEYDLLQGILEKRTGINRILKELEKESDQ